MEGEILRCDTRWCSVVTAEAARGAVFGMTSASATATPPPTPGCAFQLGRCIRGGPGATVSETSPT